MTATLGPFFWWASIEHLESRAWLSSLFPATAASVLNRQHKASGQQKWPGEHGKTKSNQWDFTMHSSPMNKAISSSRSLVRAATLGNPIQRPKNLIRVKTGSPKKRCVESVVKSPPTTHSLCRLFPIYLFYTYRIVAWVCYFVGKLIMGCSVMTRKSAIFWRSRIDWS
jgi:hypothetical protein